MLVQRNLRLLAWFNFWLDFRLYAPVMVIYFSQETGSYALGMSILSIIMLSSALLEVPTGVFSDRIGRKRTVVIGAAASVVSIVFYAIGGAYPILVIGAIFEGLSRSFFSGNNDAMLHDTLTETGQIDDYQEFLGRTSSMFQFALATASILGGIIAAWSSFEVVMWLSVIPQVFCLLISLQFIEPKIYTRESGNIYAHLREAVHNLVSNRRLRWFSAASILTFAVGEASFQFRAVFIQMLWPLWAIGFSRTIAAGLAAFSFYLSGRLIKRFGERKLLTGSVFYSETIVLLSTLFPTVLSPILMGTTSIFFGVKTVSLGGLMQREFTPQQRATMGSLNAFAGSIAMAAVSLLLGFLADRLGVVAALLIATVPMLVLPLWMYNKAFQSESVMQRVVPAEVP